MAANLTHEIAVQEARYLQQVVELLDVAVQRAQAAITRNSKQGIDWVNATEIQKDTEGNIQGMRFTPAQLSNAIFSIEQFTRTATNLTITQGDHQGNLQLVSKPENIRTDRI